VKSARLPVIVLCIISLAACTSDQVMADLSVISGIVQAIAPEIGQADPAAAPEVLKLASIAGNGIDLIEVAYKAYKASPNQSTANALQFAAQTFQSNLNQELAIMQITNPKSKDKVIRWANLIVGSTLAILRALPAFGVQTAAAGRQRILMPRASDLKRQWDDQVCQGEESCEKRVPKPGLHLLGG